jgi:hypothetical protein
MKPRIVCLLTGCIRPRVDLPFTSLKDPEIRRDQYINAIRFHLERYKYPIVFAENSGYDLSSYFDKEIAENRLEMLSFSGNDYPTHLGKGLGEYNCISYAIDHSRFIGGDSFVFKITGRYQVHNLDRFVAQVIRTEDLYLLTDTDFSRRFSDSRCFGFRPRFVQDYLGPCVKFLNESEGVYFEHIMFKCLLAVMSGGDTADLFNGALKIVGVAGSTNRPYSSGSVRQMLRDLKRRLRYWHFHNM